MFRLMICSWIALCFKICDSLVCGENSPNIVRLHLATHVLINPLFRECPHPWAFTLHTISWAPFLGGMCFDSSFALKRNICLAWKCYTSTWMWKLCNITNGIARNFYWLFFNLKKKSSLWLKSSFITFFGCYYVVRNVGF